MKYHPASSLALFLTLAAVAFQALLPVAARAEQFPSASISSAMGTSPTLSAPSTGTEVHAQLRARRETVLSSELAARIKHISVRDGERFTDGQELVRMDCALEEARLAKMRVVLAGAQKNAKIKQRLLDLNSIGILEVELAQLEVDKARADLRAQSVVLSRCAIQAPFPGRVVEVRAKEHQFVPAGQPLLEILDDAGLEIDFIVPSHWLAWLEVGKTFTVAINETGRSYPGRILRLGARVDPVSQLVKVMGEIDGDFPELIPGMSGRVSMGQ